MISQALAIVVLAGVVYAGWRWMLAAIDRQERQAHIESHPRVKR